MLYVRYSIVAAVFTVCSKYTNGALFIFIRVGIICRRLNHYYNNHFKVHVKTIILYNNITYYIYMILIERCIFSRSLFLLFHVIFFLFYLVQVMSRIGICCDGIYIIYEFKFTRVYTFYTYT